MSSCNPTLVYDPALVKSNPSARGYPMTGAGPLHMYDPETSIFDSVLPPLLPSNVIVDDKELGYTLLSNKSMSADWGFASFPAKWESSPYPGMSMEEYTFIRERQPQVGASQSPSTKVYESDRLWGSHMFPQGPWLVPGVAPPNQSKYVTQEMINQAASLPPRCSTYK